MADLRNFTYDNMVTLIKKIHTGHQEDLDALESKVDENTENIEELSDLVDDIADFGYIKDTETIYSSKDRDKFTYIEGLGTIFLPTTLDDYEYDEDTQTFYYTESDDFTYNEDDASFELGNFSSETSVRGYVSNFVNMDNSEEADVRDTEAHEEINNLQKEIVNPNILRSTNSWTELLSNTITDMWDRGEWGSQRPEGLTSIEITDCPDPNITLGWRFSNETSLSSTFNIVQRGIPYVDGDTYTISCYARGHGVLRVALGSVSWIETCDVDIDSNDWVKIVETGHDTTDQARVLFTLVGDGTAAEIDVCGMKLEKGENATDWCPSYWDMENKNLQADLDAVSAEIETVQNQVTENTTNISEVQQQVTEIIAEGGEPNVIEEIQVNGATLAIEDKTVNVPVPTKVSELDNDSGYITVSAVPTKVSELDNDSGYITESDVPTKISELTDDIGYAKESEIPTKTSELENDSDFTTGSEVRSEIAAQIAEIVAGAPEDLDTLKEIADWIEGHAEDAAAMNSEIKDNTKSIEELQDAVEDIEVPDFGYISGSETIYKSSQDSDFWYIEGQKSIVFDSDTSLVYDSSSSAITFDDSDDFTYNESSTSFEFYALASSADNDGYVSNLVDLDTGENHMIKDSEARDYIETLQQTIVTLQEQLIQVSDTLLEQLAQATTESVIEVTLLASDWSDEYPYTQIIENDKITEDTLFDVGILYPEDCDRDMQDEINEAVGYLFSIETENGSIIFKATELPEANIPLGLKGVF